MRASRLRGRDNFLCDRASLLKLYLFACRKLAILYPFRYFVTSFQEIEVYYSRLFPLFYCGVMCVVIDFDDFARSYVFPVHFSVFGFFHAVYHFPFAEVLGVLLLVVIKF